MDGFALQMRHGGHAEGREVSPTAVIIDSQSAKTAQKGSTLDPQGFDAGKKRQRRRCAEVTGRKWHIADSLGLKKAEGALVAEPQANGPAAKAGIESGDIITTVNGQPIKDARELARTIGGLAPGNAVKLDVLHKGKDAVINLTLGKLPNAQEAQADTGSGNSSQGMDVPRLGMTVAPARSVAGAGKAGVVVTGVDPKGAASDHGFKEGDVILEVAGKGVANPGDVREAIKSARADNKNNLLMRVRSGDASHYVAMPLGNG